MNVFDYLAWRKDILIEHDGLNEIDHLILCRLAYIRFDDIVSPSFETSITLEEASKYCFLKENEREYFFILDDDERLLRECSSSKRFKDIRVCAYVNHFDELSEKQFCAVTFIFPNNIMYIAFRGTDSTMVGWKEDFNMTFQKEIPAQIESVRYLKEIIYHHEGNFYVGGHSKGGNLAVYSSMRLSYVEQTRLLGVYNLDGPGFDDVVIQSDSFNIIKDKLHTYVPQGSIIGMLLEHEENFTVIHSSENGFMQHDLYSWEIQPVSFVYVDSLTNSSQFIDMTLREWLNTMDVESREKFVDGMYQIFLSTNADNVHELKSTKSVMTIIKTYKNMDDKTKEVLLLGFEKLKVSLKKTTPYWMKKMIPFTSEDENEYQQ